ncbi:MAG: hypothetical protein R2911_45870 [Caldilineaceae bacterium]
MKGGCAGPPAPFPPFPLSPRLVVNVIRRPNRDALLLRRQFIAEGFDEDAAEVAGEAGVIVGENAYMHDVYDLMFKGAQPVH